MNGTGGSESVETVNSGVLESTGERMMLESASDSCVCEHLMRYLFALEHAPGKRVLDVACGEGYGTSLLSKAGAKSVLGMDISPVACARARSRYGVNARVGDATAIDLPDQSVDLVVSFETIEHLPAPASFLSEVRRVLTDEGVLIVSTPNRPVYRSVYYPGGETNPFHCSEMIEPEFRELLSSYFAQTTLYGQLPTTRSLAAPYTLASYYRFWRRAGRHLLHRHRRAGGNPESLVHRILLVLAGYPFDLDTFRQAPDRITRRRNGRLDLQLNPFRLRRLTQSGRERPAYFVAIAKGVVPAASVRGPR